MNRKICALLLNAFTLFTLTRLGTAAARAQAEPGVPRGWRAAKPIGVPQAEPVHLHGVGA